MIYGAALSDVGALAAQFWAPRHGERRNGSTANVSTATVRAVYNQIRKDTVYVNHLCPPGAFVSLGRHYSENEIPERFGVGISAWRYAVAGLVRAGLLEEHYTKNRRYLRAIPDSNDKRTPDELA